MCKKIVFLIFIGSNSFILGTDLSLLHESKQQIQKEKYNEIEASYKSLKYNWISPLNLSLSSNINKPANSDIESQINGASLNFNQDIYRFGGISYQMSYANYNKRYKLEDLNVQNIDYYKQIYTNILEIRKFKLQLKQAQFRLKNKELEIFLKQEQYKTGIVDITLLNSAIMDKNEELKSIITIKQNIIQKEKELSILTPLEEDVIDVPQLSLISEDEFLQNNNEITLSYLQTIVKKEQFNKTKFDYYPNFSLNGETGYQYFKNDYNSNYDDDYYNFGVKVTIPIDFNRNSTIQEKKIDYLKQKLDVEDKRIEQLATYKSIISNIKNYQEYQEITKENLKLYEEIMNLTKEGFEVGYKSGYDLQIIQNTNEVDKLEINIYEINIQLELVKLYFSTNGKGNVDG